MKLNVLLMFRLVHFYTTRVFNMITTTVRSPGLPYARSLDPQDNKDAPPPSLPPLCDWADSSDCLATLPRAECPGLHKL